VNRMSRAGVSMGEAERISPLEALRAVTLYAAWQYFEENTKGSLRVGKRADFAILDGNPLTVKPMELRSIHVTETIVGGVSAWKA
ncbi:MAG: amidohydrolase family protein, partial [Oscillospiraceae bacterium]